MVFRTLGICLLFISLAAFAQGRKPAVEDFVGIEMEQPDVTPQGTEPLFNLEQDLNKLEKKKAMRESQAKALEKNQDQASPFSLFAISVVLGLPLVMWFMILSHLKRKASLESASNLEVLENYRKRRELDRKTEEEYKKVS